MQQLRAAARELSEAERRLASKLRPEDRYERGRPDPASEVRLKRFLVEIFEAQWTYSVDCRSSVCRLVVDGSDKYWMEPLQTEGNKLALFDGASFGKEAFLVMMEEPRSRGWLLWVKIHQRIRESKRIAECKQRIPSQGDLSVRIKVGADERYEVAYQGSQVDTESGACARSALDADLSEIAIPSDTVWPADPVELEVWP